jgi:hypothetical protein
MLSSALDQFRRPASGKVISTEVERWIGRDQLPYPL